MSDPRLRRVAAVAAGLLLLVTPGGALAADLESTVEQVGGSTFDVVILRPAAIGQLAIGSAVFLVAWPATFFSGRQTAVTDTLITRPFEDAFTRPLGEF